jgi:hypothetical protein
MPALGQLAVEAVDQREPAMPTVRATGIWLAGSHGFRADP